MSEYRSELLRLLDSRGYIHQVTDAEGLDSLAGREVVPGYIGFDATAPLAALGIESIESTSAALYFATSK
jgi:tyrosyl-tRNA synthetase